MWNELNEVSGRLTDTFKISFTVDHQPWRVSSQNFRSQKLRFSQ